MSPEYGYSIKNLDPEKTSKASGRDVRCSPKKAREVCNAIKGMKLEDAKEYLTRVISLQEAIPFKRHKKKRGHKKGLNKWSAGGYPQNAAYYVFTVLENAEANAEYKGMDIDKVKIKHAAISRGPLIKKNIPRAFGRSTAYYKHLSHIEIVLEEE
ncbi:MAG: 50S ribosomal protein L22 [Candidatus Helarchaeota archaeon]